MSLFYHTSFSFEGELTPLDFTIIKSNFPKFDIKSRAGITHVQIWSETKIAVQIVYECSDFKEHFDTLTWNQFETTYMGRV
uniref:Uncharacterized protein n=1 Tax=Ochrobactrum phage ORM_20 TaxID=2985243 RepID=A0A9N6ZF26_9VIRU|nr:hypothetical protein ORM20_00166 [Ochrobactrum phage ORM_20]